VRPPAVGHQQIAAGVDRDRIRRDEPVAVDAVGEALERAAAGIEPEHGRVLEIAHVQPPVAVERHAQAEAAGAGDLLDRAVGDAEDLPRLAAAPDRAVGGDGEALRVVEPRHRRQAVEEHARVHRGTARVDSRTTR